MHRPSFEPDIFMCRPTASAVALPALLIAVALSPLPVWARQPAAEPAVAPQVDVETQSVDSTAAADEASSRSETADEDRRDFAALSTRGASTPFSMRNPSPSLGTAFAADLPSAHWSSSARSMATPRVQLLIDATNLTPTFQTPRTLQDQVARLDNSDSPRAVLQMQAARPGFAGARGALKFALFGQSHLVVKPRRNRLGLEFRSSW